MNIVSVFLTHQHVVQSCKCVGTILLLLRSEPILGRVRGNNAEILVDEKLCQCTRCGEGAPVLAGAAAAMETVQHM